MLLLRPNVLHAAQRHATSLFRSTPVSNVFQRHSLARVSPVSHHVTPLHSRFSNHFATTSRSLVIRGSLGGRSTSLGGHRKLLPHSNLQQQRLPLTVQLGALSHLSSFGGGGSRPPSNNRWVQGAGMLGAATMLFGKTKYLFAALKLTKLASLGSMILTIGTYSMFFGLPYAAGMVGLILVHECGHALVMLNRGIPFSPMVFVPFMGAMIAMNKQPRDAWEDALVALGGPALGSAGAAAVAVGAHATGSQLLFALADFGFMVNLFNLLPIGSLDGGRIAGALSPYAGLAGLGLGGFLAFTGAIQSPVFYLVLMAGGYESYQRWTNPGWLPPNYYKISTLQRGALTAGYFGLVIALTVAMDANQRYKKSPEQLQREVMIEHSWDAR